MKLFGFLHKPAWEHKDAAVRLRAVQSGHAPALLALLPELAQADPDPEVRMAALRRVDDPHLLARRMRGELDERVAAVARERLLARLGDAGVPFETRRAAMLDLPDSDLLAAVAERAPDPSLRRAALEHLTRPGLLFDRCLKDPDPALRLWLLGRIDSPEALQRLADAARKRDKTLARAARERLDAMLLASGDEAALQRAALALCERAGRLARELPADRDQQFDALQAAWAELAPRVGADLQRRTDGALAMAEAAIAGTRAAPRVEAPAGGAAALPQELSSASGQSIAESTEETCAGSVGKSAAEPAAEAGAVAAGEAAVAGAGDAGTMADPDLGDAATAAPEPAETAATPARSSAAQLQQQQVAAAALVALEQALADDNLAAARDARAQVQPGRLTSAAERRRLAAADQQVAKLEQWQRWAGNSVRRRLCEDAEALQGSGMHPDALATRVKELQAEWSRLDALDGPSAPAADSALARRFRGLCHAALKPARGYFEKRREVRSERASQIDTLLAEVGAAVDASMPGALPPLRRRVTDALRELDTVAPEKRGEQGRALRACLSRIDAAIAAGREEAALEKRRLIARLRRDLGSADAEAALALAKEAQAQWSRLARSERKEEDALRDELRALVDPLFAGVREREHVRRQQQAEADAAARAVLQELDALAGADDTRLAHAEAHLEALSARWRALEPSDEPASPAAGSGSRGGRDQRPRGGAEGSRGHGVRGGRDQRERRAPRRGHPLEAEFTAALARVQGARQRAAGARERAAIEAICSAGALLDRLHSPAHACERDEVLKAWVALELPADAREALQPRLAGTPADGSDAEILAVRAELAAGLESPAHAQPLRRQEQMQRLAAKLEGSALQPPLQEIRRLLIALQGCGNLAPEQRAALQARILGAYDAAERNGG